MTQYKDIPFQKWPVIAEEEIDLGDRVICDWGTPKCDVDAVGGVLFMSKACCAACTEKVLEGARKYNEMHLVREYAKPGETFRQFVYRLRGGKPGKIKIISYGPPQ